MQEIEQTDLSADEKRLISALFDGASESEILTSVCGGNVTLYHNYISREPVRRAVETRWRETRRRATLSSFEHLRAVSAGETKADAKLRANVAKYLVQHDLEERKLAALGNLPGDRPLAALGHDELQGVIQQASDAIKQLGDNAKPVNAPTGAQRKMQVTDLL